MPNYYDTFQRPGHAAYDRPTARRTPLAARPLPAFVALEFARAITGDAEPAPGSQSGSGRIRP